MQPSTTGRRWMFWAGCLLLGGFAAISVLMCFSPERGFEDEGETARLRDMLGKKSGPKPEDKVDTPTVVWLSMIVPQAGPLPQIALLPVALDRPREARALSSDWPGWRGPMRDGHAPDQGLHLDWERKALAELWRIDIGDGFGSMAVVDKRIYTQFQDGAKEVVACYDAETGKERWRHGYTSLFKDQFGAGPRSTPTVDGDLVFTVGPTGILHALNAADGTVKWHMDMKAEFGVGVPTWAFSFSPLVVGNFVLINPGGTQGNALVALDRTTGQLRWKGLDVGGGYSSPVLAYIEGERQAIFFAAAGLVSVVPETGAELWRFPWKTPYDANIATPIVFDNYVFISSGYNAGCALVRLDRAETGSFDVKRVYQHKKMANHFSSSIYHEGCIYGFKDTGLLVCIEAANPKGKAKWDQREFQRGNMVLAEGHLIILGENGLLGVVQATPTEYIEKGRLEVFKGPLVWSAPALANGRLFVRDRRQMVCFDLRKK